jgi:hypothetical protein
MRSSGHVVGVTDELDGHVLLVAQVVERLGDLLDELSGHAHGLVAEVERRHQVPDPRPVRVPLAVAQLAHRLHPAHLDALDLLGDDDLLEPHLAVQLVVPDLDLHAAVLRPSPGRGVAGDRLGVARPLEGDGLRRQRQRRLQELRHLAGPLAGEARVVPVDPGQARRERLVVGVAHEVQPHVGQVAHAVEDAPQAFDAARRDVGDAGLEADRRHHVAELHDLRLGAHHLALFEPVPGIGRQHLGVARPLGEGPVAGQMPLDRLARRELDDALAARRQRGQQQPRQEQPGVSRHRAHLRPCPLTRAGSGGPPRRQYTSRSIVSG